MHVIQAWGCELNPQDHVQELGLVVFVCNPNTGELETSRCLELSSWLASLDVSANSIDVRDAVSKAKVGIY